MLPKRLPRIRSATLWFAFFVFNVFAACGVSFAADAAAPDVTFGLVASEYEIDEGDVIEFDIVDKQYLDPSTAEILKFEADLSPVKWDFGDDRVAPAQAYGLYNIKHWFADDRETPFVVNATHQGKTKNVSIQVRNVLPKFHNVSVTQNPQAGKPVIFKAVARDPGAYDDLTYTWNFGDGTTASGPNAIHTYAKNKTYQVTLTVADEEGRENPGAVQAGNFSLEVGDPFDFSNQPLNTIVVSGDIDGSGGEIRGTIIAGSTRNPTSGKAGGACQIRLEMRLGSEDMGVTLTARLDPGFAPGNYNIGRTTEWDGMHSDDRSTQGTFFAEFVAPKDQAARNFGGKRVGGPFWSDSGRLKITRFEDGVLELYFEADLTENIPSSFLPRKVHVLGALATTVSALAPIAAGGEIEATANLPIPDAAGTSMKPAFDLRAYYCGGEEPAEFEVIASNPGSNAVNAKYQDSGVKVRFSQVVDSDSLVHPDTLDDNLQLALLSADGDYFEAPGGWVISPENPRIVQFTPQSRLLPGVTYCVFIRAGELGVRSFGGNILAGVSLEAPSDEMARACPAAEGYQFGFAFSTRVELESVWVDVYQLSLLGEHVRLTQDGDAVVRVYTYWQNVSDQVDPNALIREFPAKVFGMRDGQPLEAEVETTHGQSYPSPVLATIKRSDLYTSEDKRHARNTVNFRSSDYAAINNYLAVVQPLSSGGVPLDPVTPSSPVQISAFEDNLSFNVHYGLLEGICASGITQEQCGWGEPWNWERDNSNDSNDVLRAAALGASEITYQVLDISQDFETLLTSQDYQSGLPIYRFDIAQACPGGYQEGVCYDGDQVIGEAAESMRVSLDALAVQVTNSYLQGPQFNKANDMLVVFVRPGLLPDPANQPVQLYPGVFPTPPVIFVQADQIDWHNARALGRSMVLALLGDKACEFRPDDTCTHTPVQGFKLRASEHWTGNWMDFEFFNKHYAEGNEQSSQLIPFLKSVPYERYNDEYDYRSNFHISAYNYAKIYEAMKRRYNYANGDSPDS